LSTAWATRTHSTTPTYPTSRISYLPKEKKSYSSTGVFGTGTAANAATRIPPTNTEYWLQKIQGNRIRDKQLTAQLAQEGWKILILWECELNTTDLLRNKIVDFLES